MNSDPVVIVSAVRTPMGSFQGALKNVPAPQLGGIAIAAALERTGIAPDAVSEALMGCVLTAGLGQAPARQAAISGGLSRSTPCTTVGKVCGSGMKAVMIGHDALLAGSAEVVVAGGMESMSRAPYLLQQARGGYRMGHARTFDHMMLDGLEDAYEAGRSMGTFGEQCVARYGYTRDAQDAFAIASVERALRAIQTGAFDDEIVPVNVEDRAGAQTISVDEGPGKINVEKIPKLRPAFDQNGTITAASSSSINDGAAALLLMRERTANRLGVEPLARVTAQAMHAQEPAWFTTAPVAAIQKALVKAGWKNDDVDLYEINEAFAVVPMVVMSELGVPHQKMNVSGGACALGHPIGASGARILVTLLHALRRQGLRRGMASLCIGGGEATAIAVERY
ncbi:acetyl-CoA C-acyltransferase [Paraburkholderia ferrariae]|uniref:acetyl-CoA C-acyltransferase n=1 Tax=Paraburkholderia ferrariae TaxID=386056 RepID=UPI000481FDA1|nr:acetyl-CoA C-acyltransferase [Paraburkholderia ferrariae]